MVLDIKKKDRKLKEACTVNSVSADFSEYYGIGYWLKKYAGYPVSLPIFLHGDHGPGISEILMEFELKSRFKKALYHNSLKIIDAESRKFKRAYVTGSAFVHYRRINKIEKSKSPTGTICFPFHSILNVDVEFDWDTYMAELKALPSQFHPITICVYYIDIEKGLHLPLLENGFDVVTAGHRQNTKFVENFYEILRTKKYATSNAYGSHVPYSIEMGIPFFYTGNGKIELNNKGNTSVRLGKSSLHDYVHTKRVMDKYEEAKILFKDFTEIITDEQKEFANVVLALNDAISPKELNKILWKEFLLNLHKIIWNWVTTKIKMFIRKLKNQIKLRKVQELNILGRIINKIKP